MPTTCAIEFLNNPQRAIYSGQLLCGTVNLTLTSAKHVRGVKIKIIGRGHCHWTTGSGKNRKSHSANESYLDEETYFIGSNDDNIELQPGSYHHTFQTYLPPQLPTSIEGGFGHIRYSVSVVMDIAMWPDKEFEVPFTVIKAINLNANPAFRAPVILKKDKTFFPCFLLCCCESSPLEMVARIPVGGYVPGQTINLELIVSNRSDQPVEVFTVQLIKEITYYAGSRQKLETIIIIETETRGCSINQEDRIKANLQVPAIPPTDSTTSNIVKVNYFCRVIGSVECCHNNPLLQLPITIGTYPILDEPLEQFPETTPSTLLPTAPQANGVIDQQPTLNPSVPLLSDHDNVSPPPSAPIQFPNDEPPTYEDAMKYGKQAEGEFTPKYPMFKRQTSYSQ